MGVELKKKPIKLGAKRKVLPPAEDTALLQHPEPQQDQAGDVRASGNAVFANMFLLLSGRGRSPYLGGSLGRALSKA